ncbi:MAG: hypothetical protein KAT62_02545 [Desulfuromonadales bacterium]|nr:hypothetical protein [Desulfuromonadales bacterium]
MAAVGAIIKSGAQYAPNLASILGVMAQSSNWELARSSRPAAEVLAAPIIDKGADQYLITEIPESDLTKSPKDHMEEMKKGLF